MNSLPEPFEVPNIGPSSPDILALPEEPTSFVRRDTEGDSSSTSRPLLDPELLVSSLTSSSTVLTGTGGDAPTLMRRIAGKWTVEVALKDCQ